MPEGKAQMQQAAEGRRRKGEGAGTGTGGGVLHLRVMTDRSAPGPHGGARVIPAALRPPPRTKLVVCGGGIYTSQRAPRMCCQPSHKKRECRTLPYSLWVCGLPTPRGWVTTRPSPIPVPKPRGRWWPQNMAKTATRMPIDLSPE